MERIHNVTDYIMEIHKKIDERDYLADFFGIADVLFLFPQDKSQNAVAKQNVNGYISTWVSFQGWI